ncbi:MAG: hypothetical protein ACM3SY_17935 [Candidatus Omnitrophota bacterium]
MKKISIIFCLLLVLGIGVFAASPVGSWNYYYSWGCNGRYSSTTITFNSNGTFSTPGYTGRWYQVEGQIIWKYSSGTIYSGTIVGNAMMGMMVTTTGTTGCWYCTKRGTTRSEQETEIDESGKKVKE